MIWIIKLFLGKKYFIKYTDKLKNGEILIFGHKIYISKEVIKMKQDKIIYFKFPWDRIGITQYFSTNHQAIDNAGTVSGKANKYAYLPCEAKIIKNTYYNDYGYAVEYEAKDERGTFVMADGHLKKKSSLAVGKTYPIGTIIGEIGSTGTSTGNHDHFRMSLNGTRVNPLDYLYVYDGQYIHPDDEKKVKYLKDVTKTYTIIVDKIPVYINSSNAKNNKSSVGTWGKGTYYVFNEAYGMINITKKQNTAGAWINPADNVIKEVEPPKEEVEEKPIEIPTEEVKPPIIEETPKDDENNTEKEPVTEDKPDETINNTPNEETNENEQPNEEIEQELEETAKKNIFVKIIKIIIDFIIGIFKR